MSIETPPDSSSTNTAAPSDSATTAVARRRISLESLAVVLLLLVLAIGAYFRFTGLNWDANHHLHPDERFLTIVGSQLQVVSDPIAYLKTSESTLNPYNIGQSFYVYGNFPMTVTRYLAEWITAACAYAPDTAVCANTYTAYDGIHLLGRFLSGLIDLVSVAFLFLIGRRLYDWRVALLGSFLLATAVMPIQQSHFFTMDNWAAGLTTVSLYCAVRASTLGDAVPRFRWRWYILFGVLLGLTMASRINVAPLGAMIGVAGLIWLVRAAAIDLPDLAGFRRVTAVQWQQLILGGLIAAVVSLITFRLAQPYAFGDSLFSLNEQWVANMSEIQRLQSPEASFPPALQWTDRAPILFPLTNMVLYGMGLTAGIAAWFGLFWALWRIVRFKPDWLVHLIPVIWSGAYFLFMGTRWVKSIRYMLPVYPTLLLLAAWALFALWDRAGQSAQARPFRRTAVAILMLLVVVPSLLWANTFVGIYQRPVTRVAASDWMFENVPSGATLIYEVDGEQRETNLGLRGFDWFEGGIPLTLTIDMPEAGTITAVRFNYLSDPDDDFVTTDDGETLNINFNGTTLDPLALNLTAVREAVTVDLPATPATPGVPVFLVAELGPGGPVRAGTSILANEHWDDLLPVGTNGRSAYGAFYTEVAGGQRPVTHPDSAEKREEVIAWLDEADYVVLSSQRAMWHLPRLPLTYPLMIRYYEALFSGELGFELVYQNHAPLQIGPLFISDTTGQVRWGRPPQVGWPPPGDLAAEEAFSVYDHPPVWIFAKTDVYSSDHTRRVLEAVDLSNVIAMNPLEATQARNGLLLSENEQAVQQANGTFADVFDPDGVLSQNPALAAVVWWLSVIALGWLAFPLTFTFLRGLPDRGYALARILALLLVSYFGWLMASLQWLPNTRGTLLLGLALLAVASALLFVRRRREMIAFVRANLAYIGLVELLALAFYLLQIGIRLGNPDVWDVIWGGEKPMDLSYFTAVLKSTTFPPYDPWFAGGYINYYYYGFVYVGALTKLLGIVPAVAYNLALPMLYSFTAVGVFSIAYNLIVYRQQSGPQAPDAGLSGSILSRAALAGGLLAAVLAVILGNLAEVNLLFDVWYRSGAAALGEIPLVGGLLQTLDGGIRLLSGQPAPLYPGDWFWTATRAIDVLPGEVQPITEFPFFTFLYGDLHAHMISLPLQLLALGWAVGLALQAPLDRVRGWETAVQFLLGGLAIGALRATNTWDWPTYLVIGALAVAFFVYRRVGRVDLRMLGQALLLVIGLTAVATLTFWPFAANYGVGYTSASLWPGSFTSANNYLTIYGVFLFAIVTWLLFEFRDWARGWTYAGMRALEPLMWPLIVAGVAYVGLLVVLVGRGYMVAPIALTLIAVSGLLGLRKQVNPARRIALVLTSCAFGLTLLVEIVVLDGDIGRMNTVFKFYMQVWLILSVVAATAVAWIWDRVRAGGLLGTAWRVAFAVLLAAAALYPLLATQAKWQIRMAPDAPHTLDGMAFMPYAEYGDTDYAGNGRTIPLASDYAALRWIQRNIAGSPVIAEAHGDNPYRSIASRVAMYTGLPTIVGWDWHQRQQRAVLPGTLVSNRIADVNELYNTADIDRALAILEQYGVEYVYVGELERTYYQPTGIDKFDVMAGLGLLDLVYQDEFVTIYRVIPTQHAAS